MRSDEPKALALTPNSRRGISADGEQERERSVRPITWRGRGFAKCSQPMAAPQRPLPRVLGEGSGYPALCQSAISKEFETGEEDKSGSTIERVDYWASIKSL
ncbi:hypothetical protein Q8A67_020335 [Cirrhinus molitorella]|uniref:Uncharacterized protein n=1 Tax=Cirrhinus molitorella TaxID=172907 RepID=A0AA88PCG5_9TELE|nr:hypothetical protein Q8A67_020335 [Cirrhinus molitorella]